MRKRTNSLQICVPISARYQPVGRSSLHHHDTRLADKTACLEVSQIGAEILMGQKGTHG